MNHCSRLLWLLTLGCFLTGCASTPWRTAVLPGPDAEPVGVGAPPTRTVTVGSTVQLTLRNGDVVEGVVTEATATDLVVDPAPGIGGVPVRIAAGDIEAVGMQYGEPSSKAVLLISLGVLAAMLIGYGWSTTVDSVQDGLFGD